MLTWVAVGLGAGAVAISTRWFMTRVDALGRVKAFPYISVGLVGLLAVLAALPGIRRSSLEHRLAKVASSLAGAKVRVHCQSLGGAFIDAGAELGYVKYGADGVPARATLIKHDQCGNLASYLKSGKHHPSAAQVVAVHVLTHEAMHMAGTTNEARAECAALQRDAATARLLGASAHDAAALARTYWLTVYPFMPDDYRDAMCAAGGVLDEGLRDGPWSS